jgi:neurofibromin 1
MTLPANSLAFVHNLSETLAKNAPYLTLEFLKEWTIGFGRADVAQKTACLQYVGPWISNLEPFASPSRDDAEESTKQVAEIIRSLISITGTERKVSEHMRWELTKSDYNLLYRNTFGHDLLRRMNISPMLFWLN